jgi:hypothetical protein
MPGSPLKRARSTVLLPAPAAISTRAANFMTPFAGVLGPTYSWKLCGLLGRFGCFAGCLGFLGVVDGCNVVAPQRNVFALLGVR